MKQYRCTDGERVEIVECESLGEAVPLALDLFGFWTPTLCVRGVGTDEILYCDLEDEEEDT